MIDKIYAGNVAAFVKYGFDSLKIDSCSQFNDMDKWQALLNASAPRPVPLENCHQGGLVPGQRMPGQTCAVIAGTLNCPYTTFRVSDDIYNHWPFVLNNINAMVPYLDDGSGRPQGRLSRPGQWAYPDMLEVGQLSLPASNGWKPADMVEDRSMFGMWCVVSAPLTLSFDVTQAATLDRAWPVLANEEAIAVNQAWDGSPGMLVGTYNATTLVLDDGSASNTQGQPQPVDPRAYRQLPGEIGMCRGWLGVPRDTSSAGPHYMVLRIDANVTLREAESWCNANETCAGFYYSSAVASNDERTKVWFKDSTQTFWMDGANHQSWTSRVKVERAPPFSASPSPGKSASEDSCFGQQVWAKRLGSGKVAVLLVNAGQPTLAKFDLPLHTLAPAFIGGATRATWAEYAPAAFAVRDIWAHSDLPDVAANASLHFENLLGHDSRFIVLTPL